VLVLPAQFVFQWCGEGCVVWIGSITAAMCSNRRGSSDPTQTIYRRARHSVSLLHAHLVFVTKFRRKLLTDPMLIFAGTAMRTVCAELDVDLVEFNARCADKVWPYVRFRHGGAMHAEQIIKLPGSPLRPQTSLSHSSGTRWIQS
jgi:hypothetical protein